MVGKGKTKKQRRLEMSSFPDNVNLHLLTVLVPAATVRSTWGSKTILNFKNLFELFTVFPLFCRQNMNCSYSWTFCHINHINFVSNKRRKNRRNMNKRENEKQKGDGWTTNGWEFTNQKGKRWTEVELKTSNLILYIKTLLYKVKQIKKNLQKYYHPSSSHHLTYEQVQCRESNKVNYERRWVLFWSIFLLVYGSGT